MTRVNSEYSICSAAIGCTACARRMVLGRGLRQADVADVAGLYHVGDGADGVLDRHLRIDPRGLIEIDIIGAQSLERIGEEVLGRRRTCVIAQALAVGIAHGAVFDGDEGALPPPAFQGFAQHQFGVAGAVEIGRVDQRDAGVERGLDGRDAFGIVGRTVAAGHAHASETDSGNLRTMAAHACRAQAMPPVR